MTKPAKRKKSTGTKEITPKIVKVVIPTVKLAVKINSSYTVENPSKNKQGVLDITLDKCHIPNSIAVLSGKYSGITATIKGDIITVFTGKHSLSTTSDTTDGILTLHILEN